MNQAEFEGLYQELEGPLFNILYRWVWNEDEAMELLHDAFLRLWEKKDEVNMTEVKAFVYKIALNKAKNHLRYKSIRKWIGFDTINHLLTDKTNTAEDHEKTEQKKALRIALDNLPEKYRQVILLHRFSEMPYAEIAQVLGIAEGTVASRIHKSNSLMKAQMIGWLE